jgi:hypothetical protein
MHENTRFADSRILQKRLRICRAQRSSDPATLHARAGLVLKPWRQCTRVFHRVATLHAVRAEFPGGMFWHSYMALRVVTCCLSGMINNKKQQEVPETTNLLHCEPVRLF